MYINKESTALWVRLSFLAMLSLCLLLPVPSLADGGSAGNPSTNNNKPPPKDPPKDPCDGAADPVSTFSGSQRLSLTDMVVGGVSPIVIKRKYDNQTEYDSPLGYGWVLTYDRRLYEYADNSVVIRYGCGKRDKYAFTGGAYQPVSVQRDRLGTLLENPDGSFVFTYLDGRQDIYDNQGRLIAEQSAAGHRLELSYSADKHPLMGASPYALDPATPMTVAYVYRLERIEERLASGQLTGNYVTLAYNTVTGRLSSVSSHDGRQVNYIHDVVNTDQTTGNLVRVDGLEGKVSSYGYNDPNDNHNLTDMQHDANSLPHINVYYADGSDRVHTQTHGNNVFTFVYGNVSTTVTESYTDAAGTNAQLRSTVYQFDEEGYVTQKTESNGDYIRNVLDPTTKLITQQHRYQAQAIGSPRVIQSKSYTYYPDGKKHTEVVRLDTAEIVTTTWTYEDSQVASIQTESSARPAEVFRTEYSYYDVNNIPTTNAASGPAARVRQIRGILDNGDYQAQTYTYTAEGRILTTVYDDGVTLHNEYTGGLPFPTRRYYTDASGNELSEMQVRYQFDSQGRMLSMWDARNNQTQYTYDDRNRLATTTNALGEMAVFTYIDDRLQSVERGRTVNPDSSVNEGQVTRYLYDNQQRLEYIQRKNDSGLFENYMQYSYSSRGDRLSQTDAENRTTTMGYDILGRLTSITDPYQQTVTFEYDAANNRTKMIDALLRETVSTYDDLNRLIQVSEDANGINAVTRYGYDAVGNLLTVTDAESKVTTYHYDNLSRRVREQRPEVGTDIYYRYDNRNRVDRVTYSRGQIIDYRYFDWGAVDRIEQYASLGGLLQRTQQFTYDDNGNLETVSDDAIQAAPLYTLSYDALNRLSSETVGYIPGANRTLITTYDRYGNVNVEGLNDGTNGYFNTQQYNALNRLEGAVINGQSFAFGYYNNDDLHTQTAPNGISHTYTYRDNGPVDTISYHRSDSSALELLDYSYDAVNNIDEYSDADGLHDFNYDALNRLTSADYPAATGLTDDSFDYDKVGNRELNTTPELWQYDANNRLMQDPNYTYQYDADGNILARTVRD
ncbi:RHS repeat protein, partial [bacterium]|nr:RHS repeat protein [bacterium]